MTEKPISENPIPMEKTDVKSEPNSKFGSTKRKLRLIKYAHEIPIIHGLKYYENNTTYDSPRNLGSSVRMFERAVSQADTLVVCELLHVIAILFEKKGIKWTLFFGTLAGQVNFHGIVPWEENWEILALSPQKKVNSVLKRFAAKNPRYRIQEAKDSFTKIFLNEEECQKARKCRNWPSLGVFYSVKKKGSFFVPSGAQTFPKESILPLTYGFFHGMLYPVPRRREQVLHKLYGGEFVRTNVEVLGLNKSLGNMQFAKNGNFLRIKYGWIHSASVAGKNAAFELFVARGEVKYRIMYFTSGGKLRAVIKK